MLAIRSGTLGEDPAAEVLAGEIAEPPLELVHHHDEVGVKRRWNRRCRLSEACTLALMLVE